ncbi:putative DNA processivity factor [Phakopsora pachyrhizi]|uniref:DNA sliding clamp PCNA n=1 Tax=Phakopsora pachyrhizi TaxID=170000 RepID=A0AAV0BIH2_PHAPC|nr:putative DNA processivity factor [Phakopsora pachyrhizi]
MFEAKLSKAGLLKLVLESVKELVTDVNFDCDEEGMKLQAMDNSHVALVSLQLRSSGFTQYRCDRTMTLGINIGSFQKIVRCASNDDILTLRAQDDADLLNVIFETEKTDRLAEYEMKMMDIDIEHLGIPDTDYDAEISLPSSEFNRIIRDLKEMGESVRIEATKEGVKFSADGDIGKGSVMLKHTAATKKANKDEKKSIIINDEDEDEEDEEEEREEEEEEEEVKKSKKKSKEDNEDRGENEGGKKQADKKEVKKEPDSDEPDYEPEVTQKSDEDEEGDLPKSKKRKLEKGKKEKEKNGDVKKDKKKAKAEPKDEEDFSVSISLQQSVSLTFSIKYLSNFTKASPLASRVTLHMSNEVPLLVAYEFETGYVRYYLAPKIEDD